MSINKLKLLLCSILAFIVIIPFVNASEQVSIKNITLESKSEDAVIKTDATSEFLKLKFDLEFKKINDYVEYKVVINNPTSDDFEINEAKSSSKYISYEYKYDDDNKIAEANKESIIYIKIIYKNKVAKKSFVNGSLKETENLVLDLGLQSNEAESSLTNPQTSDKIIIWMSALVLSITLAIILYKTTKNKKYLSIFLISILILPLSIRALEKIEISIESKIEITKLCEISPVVYWALQDNDSNGTYDTLVISDQEVEGDLQGRFSSDTEYNSEGDVPWNQGSAWDSTSLRYNIKTVSVEGELTPKYIKNWFKNIGIGAPTINADLTNLDVCNISNMNSLIDHMGYYADEVNVNVTGWDVSKVTDMSYMFSYTGYNATKFKLIGLENWNTSNVEKMNGMFKETGKKATEYKLDLSKWNTSKLYDVQNMFYRAGSNSTKFNVNISGWDTSKIEQTSSFLMSAGEDATNWSVTIPKTNNNGLNNTTDMLYGKGDSYYYKLSLINPGRTFTITE